VDLITAADIRYCTDDAIFQVKEVDIGKNIFIFPSVYTTVLLNLFKSVKNV
jgi:enoyl-CoA hydratase/carnithine racemase